MTYYTGPQTLRNADNVWFSREGHVRLAKQDISPLYVNAGGGTSPAEGITIVRDTITGQVVLQGLVGEFVYELNDDTIHVEKRATDITDGTYSIPGTTSVDAVEAWHDGTINLGPNLVTNGDFNADISGWDQGTLGASGIREWDSNNLRLSSVGDVDGADSDARSFQQVTTEIGTLYRFQCDITQLGEVTTTRVAVGSTNAGAELGSLSGRPSGTLLIDFTATSTTTFPNFYTYKMNGLTFANMLVDNVSIKEIL